MEKISVRFDDGSKEVNINGHDIRWYPNDLGFVDRILAFITYVETSLNERVTAVANELKGIEDNKFENYTAGLIGQMGDEFCAELDKAFNSNISVVFNGVNPVSPTPTGGFVYENFLEAIMPVIEDSFTSFDASREKYTAGYKNRKARRAAAKS